MNQMAECSDAKQEADAASRCDFDRFVAVPSTDNGLPARYEGVCGSQMVTPKPITHYTRLPRYSGDASMGGNDMIGISAKYWTQSPDLVRVSLMLRIHETSGNNPTEYNNIKVRRVGSNRVRYGDDFDFWNADMNEGCYLTSNIQASEGFVTVPTVGTTTNFKPYQFPSNIVATARCRTDVQGSDDAAVGCERIDFKPVRFMLNNVERRGRVSLPTFAMPAWLPLGPDR